MVAAHVPTATAADTGAELMRASGRVGRGGAPNATPE